MYLLGVLGPVQITSEEFENAALFLRLGLPSTLICHENGAFRKRSSNRRNLKTRAFHFRADRKHFENGAFWKRWPYDNHVISLPKFFLQHKSKVVVAFSNSSGGLLMIQLIFRVFCYLVLDLWYSIENCFIGLNVNQLVWQNTSI